MKVTIDRAKWNVGNLHGPSCLFSDERDPIRSLWRRSYCCLGFLGKAVGFTDAEMLSKPLPSVIDQERERYPLRLFRHSGLGDFGGPVTWQSAFAAMNDADNIDHPTRESWIAEGFRTVLGVDVEFVGEYPESP